MGRKFNWKTLSFEATQQVQFSAFPVPDGLPLPHNDPRIALLFNPGGVSREVAKQIPAVVRGLSKMSTLATLPLITKKANNVVVMNELLRQIDPELTDIVTKTRTIEDIIFDGVAYWEILLVNKSTRYPTKARHVPVSEVTEQDGEFWIRGVKVSPDVIIKFTSPRQALLPAISQSVRRAVALNATGEMYARNPMPKLMFTPTEGVDPDAEATRNAIQAFADSASETPYVYVGAALNAKPVELLSPAELQLIEQDKQVQLAIANFFDMDPEDVGISTTSRTYQNAAERRIDQKITQLSWLAQTIEQRLSQSDVTPRGYTVAFDFDEFFRAEPLTRAQVAQIEMSMGVLTVDEYRAGKGLPPLTDEQKSELKTARADTSSEQIQEVEDGS